MKVHPEVQITIQKLNEKGYGVGFVNEREYQILNALPGEEVIAQEFKRKRGISYATAKEIIKVSPNRLKEKEEHFTSCSPWQILDVETGLEVKKSLIKEFFSEFASTEISEFEVKYSDKEFNYRNKFEFSFYVNDDETITFAYHKREGGKGKYSFQTCVLAPEIVNEVNDRILKFINTKGLNTRQLKGLVNRYSYLENNVVAALYVKDESIIFTQEEIDSLLDEKLKGFAIIYSTQLSPAFVETSIMEKAGDLDIREKILNTELLYPYDGFFQINPPSFGTVASDILKAVENIQVKAGKKLIVADMYAGIGTIGIIISSIVEKVISVELFNKSREYALKNLELNNVKNLEFIEEKAEKALDVISSADLIILDPPRVGLHQDVIKKLKEHSPEYIIYLSCNPKTQAQNFNDLKDLYEIHSFSAYDFYPHTPHVESLMVLKKI